MKQLMLRFRLEKNFLIRDMDKLLVSFLKSAAEEYSGEFYEQLYDKNKSIIKSYTFSTYLPGAKFHENRIELVKDEFTMFFSDSNQAELLKFFNGFQQLKFKKYPMDSNSMQLISISVQNLNEIKDTEIIVKMQSPIIVRRHNSIDNTDIYYTCESERFAEILKENVSIFAQKLQIPVSTEDFSIQPIKCKKIVKRVFGRNVDASIGIYKLTGSSELLNILLLSGVGVRRSEGNGHFRVLY